ncbi:MAG: HAMP domain-containing protein, partial [Gammaproteobacteria bacterium]|nr:HAMP domain-containing protein [Gammaproteobacteria bacterium]
LNLYKLVRQYRDGVAGSRLTVRLVLVFVILSVIPVSVVYYFSLQFLQRGVDSWFDVRIERSLEDALELSQVSLGLRQRELSKEMSRFASRLSDVTDSNAGLMLSDMLDSSGAVEMSLLGTNNRIIAFSSLDPAKVVPHRSNEDVLMQVRHGNRYVGLEPIKDAGIHVRLVYPVPVGSGVDTEFRILQALYPIDQRVNKLADNVQQYFTVYKKLNYLRGQLKNSFLLTLSLVLLLSLFAAIWVAFFSAQRLMAPVRNLAEGTRAVAEGDYEKQLPVAGYHELGFLVQSFNDMTRKIARASSYAQESQHQVESQRAYLEAVLENLSSGVMTLDHNLNIRTVNSAAGKILSIDFGEYLSKPIDTITQAYAPLKRFVDSIKSLSERPDQWQEEIIIFAQGGRKVLMCRGTTLIDESGDSGDHVIVFDDITTLIQAQRDAAWGEVARRLAHEIKNPLTPIQLSAERLQHKLEKKVEEKEAGILKRSTETIVQQVEAMKEMVNAFTEYARAPQTEMHKLDFNKLIYEVTEMYKMPDLKMHRNLDQRAPIIQADSARLRQLLHNLVKNALEAMSASDKKEIDVSTRCMDESGCRFVEFNISDKGPGFPEEDMDQYFEPYVTTKSKGTGLGLAIVKKIVEEHGGMVTAGNLVDHGGVIIIRLPVIASQQETFYSKENDRRAVSRG